MLLATTLETASQTLSDALASGDTVLLIAAAVVIAAVVGLKLAGKSVPIVDTVLETLLNAFKSTRPKPAPGVTEITRVQPLQGSMGAASSDEIAAVEAKLRADGFVKQADGTWKRA